LIGKLNTYPDSGISYYIYIYKKTEKKKRKDREKKRKTVKKQRKKRKKEKKEKKEQKINNKNFPYTNITRVVFSIFSRAEWKSYAIQYQLLCLFKHIICLLD